MAPNGDGGGGSRDVLEKLSPSRYAAAVLLGGIVIGASVLALRLGYAPPLAGLRLPGRRKKWPFRVYVDGCFDTMYYGHCNALRQAHKVGDELVVGVVSDAETRANKGTPVTPINERKWRQAVMLGANFCRSNYATKAADTHTRSSFDDLISQDQAQRACKSKPVYPAVEIPQDNKKAVYVQSVGKRISAEDKKRLLVNTLLDLKDSKEVVYGTLDAWVAWEQNFPLALLKRALLVLEKEEQWHRIVQVLKWMLSKGQGTTMGTYEQLICALEKDNRPEEAHTIWVKKISYDLHSVPWRFCDLMLSIYYRNNMLERLVKLFKDIESYGRKPPRKSVVRKVVDAYELLGLLEEKNSVLQKYDDLFNGSGESPRKLRKFSKRGIAAGRVSSS